MSVDQTKLNAVLANLPGDAAKIVAAIQGVRGIAQVNAVDIAAAQGNIANLQKASTGQGTRLTAVETKVADYADVKTDLSAAKAGVASLQTRVTAVETALSGDIESTLAALEAADVLFAQEDQSIATSLATAQADIVTKHNAQQVAIASVVTASTAAQTTADIAVANAASASAEAQIALANTASLTSALATANSKINELTSALNALVDALSGEAAAVDVI